MRCCHCKQKEATKSHEKLKNGKKTTEYYCMDCYHSLFLDGETKTDGETLSVCPYCVTALQEVVLGKLVGCAHCYQAMREEVMQLVIKMQGDRAHTGKTPPLEYGETHYGGEVYDEVLRKKAVEKARFERQCRELEIIIAKLQAENNYEDAKGYADKLSSMRSNGSIEEEFVWRTRQTLSKQS
ncbi:MAG: hypothetical protein IIX02_06740 [Clostridia bacterium]|nr:hypothetical protein [Clostridia bacterium]